MEHGCSVKWASNRGIGPSEFDDNFVGRVAQLSEQDKVVVMPITDFVVNQFNLWA